MLATLRYIKTGILTSLKPFVSLTKSHKDLSRINQQLSQKDPYNSSIDTKVRVHSLNPPSAIELELRPRVKIIFDHRSIKLERIHSNIRLNK